MNPSGNDYLIAKFTHDKDPNRILLLRHDGCLVALMRPSGEVVHQEGADAPASFARDLLIMLGWKETTCLRPYDEEQDG